VTSVVRKSSHSLKQSRQTSFALPHVRQPLPLLFIMKLILIHLLPLMYLDDGWCFTAHKCWFAKTTALVTDVSVDTSYPGHVGMCPKCAYIQLTPQCSGLSLSLIPWGLVGAQMMHYTGYCVIFSQSGNPCYFAMFILKNALKVGID